MLLSWRDLNTVTKILNNCNIPTTIAMVKIISIWYHKHDLKYLVREVFTDWKVQNSEKKLALMWRNARMSRFFSMGCIFLTEGTLLMQCMVGLLEPISYALGKKTNGTEWPLYMIGSFPYDTQVSPNYQISMFGQLLSNVFASIAFSTSDSFFVVLMLHLISQLSILKLELLKLPKKINNINDKVEFIDRFSLIHMRYNQLWRFSMTIEETFSTMFLIQMVPCIFVLCTQGYQLIMITAADNTSPLELLFMIYFLVLFLFTIFLYCYISELLRQESVEISHAAYNCDWFILPAKQAQLLVFMINRAQHPFLITVGKFANFSLQLYCQILKTSAGYLSMLLAVKNKMSFETYRLIWIMQFFAAIISAAAFTSFDGFFIFSILHLCAQLLNLQLSIRNISRKSKQRSFVKLITVLVNRHIHLQKLSYCIEGSFNPIFLVQMNLNIITICLQGYQLVMILRMKNFKDSISTAVFVIVFTSACILSLFTYCFVAEKLRSESSNIFHVIYDIPWYEMKPSESKMILNIMQAAMKPFTLTAGKLLELSFNYFTKVLNCSAGYLSILLAIQKNKNDTQ
ncbi:odorant receptor 22c-like [Copidosoma floridanum]|uniref:odorant receptor 22c-like n=1 Tax=Copidosoma floridanum TaxID=29053 RepID=UPI000C6F63E3|nr:odorant receptor 22c-like [Copidosoma floridanum]